jgi:hypothetical protein
MQPINVTTTHVIDRTARDKAAYIVESYWAGEISNRRLVQLWPDSRDLGVIAIDDFMWLLYDDTKEHRVRDQDKNDPELASRIAKCVEFLRSDEQYAWPHFAHPGALIYPKWMIWASFGLAGISNYRASKRTEQYWRDMNAAGDISAWPFVKSPTGDKS